MKYVILEVNGLEVPILFPDILPHLTVRQAFPRWPLLRAGFLDVTSEAMFNCYGRSVGLGISSDPAEDTGLVTKYFGQGN